jgi:hypothetical protein
VSEPWVTPAAVGAAVVLALVAWLLDRRRRVYADSPTTPAAAVFAGRNEVKGRAWVESPLHSHLTATPSVWWEYELEEEREHTRTVTSTDSKGNRTTRTETYRQWHRIDHKQAAVESFEVVDDTGAVPVLLGSARVVARQVRRNVFRDHGRSVLGQLLSNRTGRYRETECVVGVGDQLFVVGEAELDDDTCVPRLGGKVLVSTRSEESHNRWLAAGVAICVVLALAAAAFAAGLIVDPEEPVQPAAWAVGVGIGLLLLAVAWLVTVHNRLRLVAQGATRAWSLIDVQLTRRHDLIPNLARVVAAHGEHEAAALHDATEQRARRPASDGASVTADAASQTAQLRQVLAVAERYPQLAADQSFLRLQRELADTETRIAASRTFYNDSVTLLRDRSQSFPGVLVARRIGLPSHELIAAEGFEHTVPPVRHAFAAPAPAPAAAPAPDAAP